MSAIRSWSFQNRSTSLHSRKNGPETEESTLATRDPEVLYERTGVLPVLETDGLSVGSTSGSQDDSEDDETDDRQNLDRAEPELGLAVDAVRLQPPI